MANWLAIKAEYISTDISTRKLAEKHGVSASAVMKRSAAEKWTDERKQQGSMIGEKVKQNIAAKEADRITRLISIGDKLAEKLERAISDLGEMCLIRRKTWRDEEAEDGSKIRTEETQEIATRGEAIISAADLRNLASALKDLRDVVWVDARDTGGDGITIIFEGEEAKEASG